MKMTNNEIYGAANLLMEHFQDNSLKLPVKVNFYLQKNKKLLIELAQDIEKNRMDIANQYGTLDEQTGQYQVEQDKIEKASNELNELFNLEQDVKIYKVSIEDFKDEFVLTTGQMDALMFMIED